MIVRKGSGSGLLTGMVRRILLLIGRKRRKGFVLGPISGLRGSFSDLGVRQEEVQVTSSLRN